MAEGGPEAHRSGSTGAPAVSEHKTTQTCGICGRRLGAPLDPTTEDCGGHCLRCMADAGDPECVAAMRPMNDRTQERPCRACQGRGDIGEPRVIYPEPTIGSGHVDPRIRYAVETCPVCEGSGRDD